MGTFIEAVGVATGRGWRRSGGRRLADAAAARALAGARRNAHEVDLLLNAGIYHDRILGEPALAALIQEDIDANPEDPHAGSHGTFSFDVANGSCGLLTGLQVADGFLRAGSARHALVLASDADPGRRLAPGFPFAPVGAAILCAWHPGPEGLLGFRFSAPARTPAGGDADDGVRARVGFRGGRNRLTIDESPAFAETAAALAADVAAKLLADQGLGPGDVDALAANPLEPAFLDLLGARVGLAAGAAAGSGHGRIHTAALGVALEPVLAAPGPRPRTILLVSAGAGPVAGAALARQ